MKRYQVYLHPHSVRVLDEVATVAGFSRSRLIQEAVDAVVQRFSNILATLKPSKKVDYSWWDEMVGSITVGDGKKTVNISENIDELYYR